MDDLVRDFLVESGENLDRLDQELVQLESDPSSRDLLSSIFRTIHTIKGSCGFLGFAKLEKVAHAGESLLSRLRDGKLLLNAEITSGLLAMVDAVRKMLAEIKTTEQDGKEDYASLIENLTRLLQQVKEDSVPDQSSAPRPPVRKSAWGRRPLSSTGRENWRPVGRARLRASRRYRYCVVRAGKRRPAAAAREPARAGNERGAEATLEALSRGATDYVTKPSNTDIESTFHRISDELIPKIKAFCHVPASLPVVGTRQPVLLPPKVTLQTRKAPTAATRVHVVAIGVSTGGPEALAKVLPALPAKFPVPVVIAQHMPPIFTSLLASRLSAKSSLPVRECRAGEPLLPGCVWIAPGDYHMVVNDESGVVRLRVHQGPRENFCRPSVDVLFRSVAHIYGAKTLAVILTGMGQDGFKGCEELVAAGARVIVQDEATSVVWGMPGFVARAGLAEKILPLDQIGPEIVRRVAGQAMQVHAT